MRVEQLTSGFVRILTYQTKIFKQKMRQIYQILEERPANKGPARFVWQAVIFPGDTGTLSKGNTDF